MSKTALATAIQNTFEALIAQLNTCLPGEIVTYDYKKKKASVKPLIKRLFLNGETLDLPVIHAVPVVFPGTASLGIHFPLKKGDPVLLVFSQRSLDKWLQSGEDVNPGDSRKFDLSDAVAFPGLTSFNKGSIADNNEDIFIKTDGRKVKIGNVTNELYDGVLTGKTIDPFTGTAYSILPGQGLSGKNMSSKVFSEF